MVAPVVKDTIEWKVTWMETRKAVCIWKEPVPQTDTGTIHHRFRYDFTSYMTLPYP